MASLIERLRPEQSEQRYSLSQLLTDTLKFGGHSYPSIPVQTTYGERAGERIGENFENLVRNAYSSGGVVFACQMVRLQVFSQARFAFVYRTQGVKGDPFTTEALGPLDRPWPNGSTAELLARMEQDVSLSGNFFATVKDGQIKRLRPDWVTIIHGSENDPVDAVDEIESTLVGYQYKAGVNGKPTFLTPEQVCHFSPYPDPLASWRGMSWLTPVIREIEADKAATAHKLKFFEQGATPNMVVTLDKTIGTDAFKAFRDVMEDQSSGLENAYKTLYLGGGADVEVVGQSFEQMSFKATQGAGETRIAAAAGVPPVLVGLSEGLSSATYSNYGQARRRYSDITMEHEWLGASTSLESLVRVPENAELVHDTRGMAFLREDEKDAAEIQSLQSSAMRQLVDGGFEPDTVINAVNQKNWNLLKHTGLLSVQTQPPGTTKDSAPEPEE